MVKLDFWDRLRNHPVVFVLHTTHFVKQQEDIGRPIFESPAPIPAVVGVEHVVKRLLAHRHTGRGYQVITIRRSSP